MEIFTAVISANTRELEAGVLLLVFLQSVILQGHVLMETEREMNILTR